MNSNNLKLDFFEKRPYLLGRYFLINSETLQYITEKYLTIVILSSDQSKTRIFEGRYPIKPHDTIESQKSIIFF